MRKDEFIELLNQGLRNYPDKNDVISYYFELISDEVEAGKTEDEVIDSLGNIDDIINNIMQNSDYMDNNTNNVSDYEIRPSETTNSGYSEQSTSTISQDNELHGGRKFWNVIWRIATVFFCVLSVVNLVHACCFVVISIAAIVAGGIVMSSNFYPGLMIIGAGVWGLGFGIVFVYFSIFLKKCMFRNRNKWLKNVENSLRGVKNEE